VSVETSNNIDYRNAKGWLKDGERQLLFELASQLPGNAVILNIGVEYGASLACLRAGNPTALIYGVDLDISKAVSDYAGCLLIQEDSHHLVNEWRGSIDLIFVDGDHGEAGVLLDAKFADFLPVGGIVAYQDCYDYDNPAIVHLVCPGVNAAVDKWFAVKQLEFEEILPSVDTTRIFKRVRVKEHEQPKGLADRGGPNTHF
jgi:hypothetical protein